MDCSACRTANPAGARFCSACGAILAEKHAGSATAQKKAWGFKQYFWVGVLCLLAFVALLMAIGGHEVAEAGKRIEAERQKQAEARRAFESTPEGQKSKAAREKAEREVETKKVTRVMTAQNFEQTFLNRGFDVHCSDDEDKLTLIVHGPAVNRVFAHQFMGTRSIVKSLREAGFTTVSFWNNKSGFSSDLFMQDYGLTR